MTIHRNDLPAGAADEALESRWTQLFETDLAHDARVERRLLVRELVIILVLCGLVLARRLLL